MDVFTRVRARLSGPLARESGFTMVDLLVAIFLLAVGVIAVIGSLDAMRTSTTTSSKVEAATHVAEQEIENLRQVGFKNLALNADPGTSANPDDPRSGVVAGSPPSYRPSSDVPALPLIIDATSADAVAPSSAWSASSASGTVYRFITKGSGASCVESCPRRVTVAVTVNGAAKAKTVTMSTLVADAEDPAQGETSTPPPPTPEVCPCVRTLYAYDTPASFATRQPITGDHTVHNLDTYPDLMGTDPIPNPYAGSPTPPFAPPMYNYSTDITPGNPPNPYGAPVANPGGKLVDQDGGCDSNGDQNKSVFWITNPVLTDTVLTGNFSASVWSQIAGPDPLAVPSVQEGWLCLSVLEVRVDATGKVTNKTDLWKCSSGASNGCNYHLDPSDATLASYQPSRQREWPTAPEEENWDMALAPAGPTKTVRAGYSLGIKLEVYDHSSNDEYVLYDHPNYDSSFQVESTPAFP